MMKKQEGFTLVELMVAMIIFLFAIMATSQVFTSLVRQFKQQTKITETNIEGVVGLEMFRRDIEKAGFGLPWDMNGATYSEAVNDPITAHNDTVYNDEAAEDPPGLAPHQFQRVGVRLLGHDAGAGGEGLIQLHERELAR